MTGGWKKAARPITYQRVLPTYREDLEAHKADVVFLTKSADWEYEQEWRVLQGPGSKSSPYISLPRNSIATVIVGVGITEDNVRWVQDWIRSFGGRIKLLQTGYSRTNYEMEIEPYNPVRFEPDD